MKRHQHSAMPLKAMVIAITMVWGTQVSAQEVSGSPSAQGQEAKAENKVEGAKKVDQVQVQGNREYDQRRQDTASKIVVTKEEIQRYGDTNLTDVLKRLPGVSIPSGAPTVIVRTGPVPAGSGGGGGVRMRGLGAYTQVLINGQPSPPGFSIDTIAPDNVERIEVIRSATADMSTQAIAGAINIITKTAVVTAQRDLRFGLSYENGGWSENLGLSIADKDGNFSYSLPLNYNRTKIDRPSQTDDLSSSIIPELNYHRQDHAYTNGSLQLLGSSPRFNWNFGTSDIITWQNFLNATHAQLDFGLDSKTLSGTAPALQAQSGRNENDSRMLRSNLIWMHRFDNKGRLESRYGYSWDKRSQRSDLNGQGALQSLQRQRENGNRETGWTFAGKYTVPYIEEHDFSIGWDGAWRNRSETDQQSDRIVGTGGAAGGIGSTEPLSGFSFKNGFDARVNRFALFAQDEWNYTKNLSIYTGLRWEGIRTNSHGSDYAAISNRSSVWSPILQTLYKLPDNNNDQLRFGLARTYKAPDTARLLPRRAYTISNSATNPDNTGNPQLKPELSWGLDLGYEHYFSSGGMVNVNLFARRIEDFTRINIAQENGRWVSRPINDGQASAHGIEFDAKLPMRALMSGSEVPDIEWRANLALNRSRIDAVKGPNNRLDYQTPVTANVGFDYKLSSVPLTIGANYNFQNGGLVKISDQQTVYTSVRRSLDAYALWRATRLTNLRLSLSNLLHDDSYSYGRYVDNERQVFRQGFAPAYASVRLNLETKF